MPVASRNRGASSWATGSMTTKRNTRRNSAGTVSYTHLDVYKRQGVDRPPIKTPLEGLYIVGAEAGGSGVGTELAVNSAIEFFDTYVA